MCHWDDVKWPWSGSIPKRSRSYKTFKGQSSHASVHAITYLWIEASAADMAVLWTALFEFVSQIHKLCLFCVIYLSDIKSKSAINNQLEIHVELETDELMKKTRKGIKLNLNNFSGFYS